MHVVFLSAECEPWAKTGGLADVVDALARALGRIETGPDRPVDVFLPRYRSVPVPADAGPGRVIRVSDPLAAAGMTDVAIVDVEANGYRLRLVDHPPAFDRDNFYGPPGGEYDDNAWRFGLFSRAALETIRTEGEPVDVIHAHDWHAAPALIFRDAFLATDPIVGRAATMLTIHNLAYHGWTPRDRIRQLGLRPGDGIVAPDADGLDLLREGIRRAELVNTVSPGYAREALTPEYGMGLDPDLRARGDRFVGILNGLDNELWNPATDGDIPATYSRDDRTGKAACRAALLGELGFEPADTGPVLGMIGRLDRQKGFDLLADAAPRLVAAGARIVALGSGDPALADQLRKVAAAHPDRVALVEAFDRALARRIYAGADFFVMPSRFEPCGQGHMISLRYGTPPIVRRTGGLRDSVVDETERLGEGTGFVFDDASADGLVEASLRAFAVRSDPADWDALLDRGMAEDFSWERSSAPRYAEAYERAAALRRGAVGPR